MAVPYTAWPFVLVGDMIKDSFDLLKNKIKWICQNIPGSKKTEKISLLLSVVLVILAIVSITKIIQIHAAEAKQEKEIQALQQEYISNSSDKKDLADKSAASSYETDEATKDDPNAWYHDIDVDLAGLKKLNPDIVGWIYFEGDAGISYPLFYSGDDYYLKHNYRKEEESAGSIYIDKNN